MPSLSMSFLFFGRRARERERESLELPVASRRAGEKPAQSTDFASTQPAVGGAPERSQTGVDARAYMGPRRHRFQARGRDLGLFKQPNPAVHSCRCACPALRCEQLAGSAHGHRCDCIRRAHSRQPSQTRHRSARHRYAHARRSRRGARTKNAPGPAPLRRGRPARRREEVDARDDPGHGARQGGAQAADGSQKGPEGAREAEQRREGRRGGRRLCPDD